MGARQAIVAAVRGWAGRQPGGVRVAGVGASVGSSESFDRRALSLVVVLGMLLAAGAFRSVGATAAALGDGERSKHVGRRTEPDVGAEYVIESRQFRTRGLEVWVMKKGHIFQVVIEQDEAGYFVAECPALRACYAQGKTYEEVVKNIQDVIALCLQELKAKGKKIPKQPEIIGVRRVEVAA